MGALALVVAPSPPIAKAKAMGVAERMVQIDFEVIRGVQS